MFLLDSRIMEENKENIVNDNSNSNPGSFNGNINPKKEDLENRNSVNNTNINNNNQSTLSQIINYTSNLELTSSLKTYFNPKNHLTNPSVKKLLFQFLIFLVLEFLFKSSLDDFSMFIQTKTNNTISCSNLKIIMFFEYNGKLLFYILLLQYSNLYACFLFWFTSMAVPFSNGVIKLFFQDVRPFWINPTLEPCLCATNYGNPSTSSFNILPISLIVLYAPYNTKRYPFLSSNLFKKCLLVSVIFWNIIVSLVRFYQNAHSLNQLIYGAAYGLMIYYLIFYIIGLDPRNKSQFIYLCQNGLKLALYSSAIFVVGMMIIYLMPIGDLSDSIHERLNTLCPDSFTLFVYDSYVKAPSMMSITTLFIFLYVDYIVIYKRNENEFLNNTFEEEGERFNNNLSVSNLFIKLGIYMFIIKVIYDEWIVQKRDSFTFYYWFVGPFRNSFFLGFLHVFGIKYLFDFLNLNDTKSSKLTYKLKICNDNEQNNCTDGNDDKDALKNNEDNNIIDKKINNPLIEIKEENNSKCCVEDYDNLIDNEN